MEDGVSLGCEFGLWRVDDSQQWSMELTPFFRSRHDSPELLLWRGGEQHRSDPFVSAPATQRFIEPTVVPPFAFAHDF